VYKLENYLHLILGMSLVTYLPRLVPLLFLSKKELSDNLKLFLQYIPYASLSILIVRGILTSPKEMIIPTIVGVTVAALIAYKKSNLVLSVFMGIFASFIIINI